MPISEDDVRRRMHAILAEQHDLIQAGLDQAEQMKMFAPVLLLEEDDDGADFTITTIEKAKLLPLARKTPETRALADMLGKAPTPSGGATLALRTREGWMNVFIFASGKRAP